MDRLGVDLAGVHVLFEINNLERQLDGERERGAEVQIIGHGGRGSHRVGGKVALISGGAAAMKTGGGGGVTVESGVGEGESRRTVATLAVTLPIAASAALSIGLG